MAISREYAHEQGEDSALPEGTHSDQAQLPDTSSEALPPSGDEVEKELVKKIFRLLWGYALAATIARLIGPGAGFLGFIDLVAARTKGVDVLFRFLYYALPFIALYWADKSRLSQRCLTFVRAWAATAIWSHIPSAIISYPMIIMSLGVPYPSYNALLFKSLSFILGVVMLCLLVASHRLSSCRHRANPELCAQQNRGVDLLVTLSLLLLLCFSPYFQLQKAIDAQKAAYAASQVPRLDEFIDPGANIKGMQSSPDGKYLAVGTEKGLYLWDVDTRACIWQDLTISPDILRFSRSGKYLAVAKSAKGIWHRINGGFYDELKEVAINTLKPLAIYEVATRKPLPLRLLPRHPEKPQLILDIAFDAGEKNLYVASGWSIREKPDFVFKGYINSSVIPLATGIQRQPHTVADKELKNWYSWFSTSYGEDALRLFHLQMVKLKNLTSPDRRNIVWYDTQSWQRRVVEQHEKYDVHIGDGSNSWIEWREQKGQLYFLAAEIGLLDLPDGKTWRKYYVADIFGVVDLKNKTTRDLYQRSWKKDVDIYLSENRFIRIAFSPDGTRAALLGRFGGGRLGGIAASTSVLCG